MTGPQVRLLARELATFGGVGAVAFGVQIAMLNFLLHHGIGPLTANAAATVVSCVVAFVGNRHLSFRHRRGDRAGRELGVFVVVNGIAFVVSEAVLATCYLIGAQHDRVAVNVFTVAGIAVGTVLRFWAYRRYVFVRIPAAAEGAVAASSLNERSLVR